MSLYFAIATDRLNAADQEYRIRNLSYRYSQMSALNVLAFATHWIPHYSSYIEHFAYVIFSSFREMVINIATDTNVLLPFSHLPSKFTQGPDVVSSFDRPLTSQECQIHGAREVRISNIKHAYLFKRITPRTIDWILADGQKGSEKCAQFKTTCSIIAARFYFSLGKWLRLAHNVHAPKIPQSEPDEDRWNQYKEYSWMRFSDVPAIVSGVQRSDEISYALPAVAPISVTEKDFIQIADFSASRPGRCFEYFKGCLPADPKFFTSFFTKYALKNYGGDNARRMVQVERLADAEASLASTDSGKELIHMLKGFSMAIETGAIITYLQSGDDYAGFVLELEGLQLIIDNRLYGTQNAADLTETVHSLNSHSSALTKICRLLSDVNFDAETTDGKKRILPRNVTGTFDLVREIRERKDAIEEGMKAEINAQLINISFPGEEFLPMSKDNILALISKYHEGNAWKKREVKGLYVREGIPFEARDDIILLSAFGKNAPSPIIQGGIKLTLQRDKEGDPFYRTHLIEDGKTKTGAVKTKKTRVHTRFTFFRAPLRQALRDWSQLEEQGFVLQKRELEKGNHPDLVSFLNEDADSIWEALRVFNKEAGPIPESQAITDTAMDVGRVEPDEIF